MEDVPDFFWLCPPRCYTCGKSVGHLFEIFLSAIKTTSFEETETLTVVGKVLDDLLIKRPCCRCTLMSPTKIFFDSQNIEIVKGNEDASNISLFQQLKVSLPEETRIPDMERKITVKIDDLEFEHEYIDPEIPGVPTFNPLKNRHRQYKSTLPESIIGNPQEKPSANSHNSVEVLSGATYLAY